MKTVQIMWILNITPDSFYDGGNFLDISDAKDQIEKMIDDGVWIIDVWGFSSRPGAEMPTVEEELSRILPVMEMNRSMIYTHAHTMNSMRYAKQSSVWWCDRWDI